MSREIKFRGWDGKEMHRVCYVTDKGIGALGNGGMIIPKSDNLHALMQYTGLKDKNGVEAFESDIVEAKLSDRSGKSIGTCIGHIIFNEYEWALEMEDDHFPLASWSLVDSFVVLGNIYQHPELLK